MAASVTASLQAVGFTVNSILIPRFEFYSRLNTPGEPFDLAIGAGWAADYDDPVDFLDPLLNGNNIGSTNLSNFNDGQINGELAEALSLVGAARYARYAQIDGDAMTKSPMVVLGDLTSYDFFSGHMGCQHYQPIYGVDLTRLCKDQ
jgi:ABC-type transport system substrate-binding protein